MILFNKILPVGVVVVGPSVVVVGGPVYGVVVVGGPVYDVVVVVIVVVVVVVVVVGGPVYGVVVVVGPVYGVVVGGVGVVPLYAAHCGVNVISSNAIIESRSAPVFTPIIIYSNKDKRNFFNNKNRESGVFKTYFCSLC